MKRILSNRCNMKININKTEVLPMNGEGTRAKVQWISLEEVAKFMSLGSKITSYGVDTCVCVYIKYGVIISRSNTQVKLTNKKRKPCFC